MDKRIKKVFDTWNAASDREIKQYLLGKKIVQVDCIRERKGLIVRCLFDNNFVTNIFFSTSYLKNALEVDKYCLDKDLKDITKGI